MLPEALQRMGRCVASGSVCRPLAGSHLTYPFGLHHPPGSCRVVHPTHVSGLSARATRPVSTGLWLPLALRRVAFASWVVLGPLRRGPPFRRSAGLLASGQAATGLPRSAPGEVRRGRAPSLLRGLGVRQPSSGQEPAPWPDIAVGCHRSNGDLPVTQPHRRFTGVRPSRLSLARVHPDGFGLPLGFTRLLSHASLPGACAGREPTWTLIGAVGLCPRPLSRSDFARRTALYGTLRLGGPKSVVE